MPNPSTINNLLNSINSGKNLIQFIPLLEKTLFILSETPFNLKKTQETLQNTTFDVKSYPSMFRSLASALMALKNQLPKPPQEHSTVASPNAVQETAVIQTPYREQFIALWLLFHRNEAPLAGEIRAVCGVKNLNGFLAIDCLKPRKKWHIQLTNIADAQRLSNALSRTESNTYKTLKPKDITLDTEAYSVTFISINHELTPKSLHQTLLLNENDKIQYEDLEDSLSTTLHSTLQYIAQSQPLASTDNPQVYNLLSLLLQKSAPQLTNIILDQDSSLADKTLLSILALLVKNEGKDLPLQHLKSLANVILSQQETVDKISAGLLTILDPAFAAQSLLPTEPQQVGASDLIQHLLHRSAPHIPENVELTTKVFHLLFSLFIPCSPASQAAYFQKTKGYTLRTHTTYFLRLFLSNKPDNVIRALPSEQAESTAFKTEFAHLIADTINEPLAQQFNQTLSRLNIVLISFYLCLSLIIGVFMCVGLAIPPLQVTITLLSAVTAVSVIQYVTYQLLKSKYLAPTPVVRPETSTLLKPKATASFWPRLNLFSSKRLHIGNSQVISPDQCGPR